MKVSLKYALPTVMGFVGAVLIVWDIHNQRIIRSVGMGWDTGHLFGPIRRMTPYSLRSMSPHTLSPRQSHDSLTFWCQTTTLRFTQLCSYGGG